MNTFEKLVAIASVVGTGLAAETGCAGQLSCELDGTKMDVDATMGFCADAKKNGRNAAVTCLSEQGEDGETQYQAADHTCSDLNVNKLTAEFNKGALYCVPGPAANEHCTGGKDRTVTTKD